MAYTNNEDRYKMALEAIIEIVSSGHTDTWLDTAFACKSVAQRTLPKTEDKPTES